MTRVPGAATPTDRRSRTPGRVALGLTALWLMTSCGPSNGASAQPPTSSSDRSQSPETNDDTTTRSDPPQSSWTATPEKADLGLVGANEERVALFRIQNTGSVPMRILDVKKSCGCLRPSFDRNEFAPDESRDLEVALTTGDRSAHEFTLEILVRQGGLSRKTVVVRYAPKPSPVLDPPSLHMGYTRIGATIQRDVDWTLFVPGRQIDERLQVEIPESLPVRMEIADRQVSDDGGSFRMHFVLRFYLDTSVPARLNDRIRLWTDQSEPVWFTIRGLVHPGVYFEMVKLHLGRLVSESQRERTVELLGEPALLAGVEIQSEDDWLKASLDPWTEGADRRTVRLSYRAPLCAEAAEFRTLLRVRGEFEPETTLELQMSVGPR